MTDVSAILLAGGLSSRMGRNKAELPWHGTTLAVYQVSRLREMGIEDILVSGYPKPIDGTRFVADLYPLKGPLGGIHTGLLRAAKPHCLVLSVDAPLVPADTLCELVRFHVRNANEITVLSHGGRLEPLIGVYERRLGGMAEEILRSENSSVRVLFEKAGLSEYAYSGDEHLLMNCNTPADYTMLLTYS